MLSVVLGDDDSVGGGLKGVGRFFTDRCGCGSAAPYGMCCGAEEGDLFIDFCEQLKLECDIAIEIGQLAWRIARDTPAARWSARADEIAEEMLNDDPEQRAKLLQLVGALLGAHRIMFPRVDGALRSLH
jgi:hypothetical protein